MFLKDKIIKLIESNQEDDFYDFKESWHNNKAEFLHDLLSLANNRTNEDGLLIFGVRDKTFEVIGVEQDSNRKTQQNIIDFLNSKNFFGGIRPSIELQTILYLNHQLDILIIKNTTDTPYYMNEKYSDGKYTIRPNFIYTRIKDTNTPIDKSADINQVEYLWKKRFKLTASPIIRIFDELKNKEHWKEKSTFKESNTFYFNIYSPEYTVEIIPDDDYGNARYEYILKEFLYCENDNYRPAKDRLDECVLYFENQSQKIEFENYLLKFKADIQQEILDEIKTYDYDFVSDNHNEDLYIKQKLSNIKVYKKYYDDFIMNYS